MEHFDFLNSFLFPYVNLIVFVVLAYWVLKKPFVAAVATKRQSFEDLLKRASEAKEDAEKRNLEIKSRLAQLDREVDEIKRVSKEQAETEALSIVTSAHQLAEHLKKEAKRIAEAEVAAAKVGLEQEILKLVRSYSVSEIQKNLDKNMQHRVVQQGLEALAQVKMEDRR